MHNGFVTINKEKMSKSLGNIISISDAVKKYSGQVVRLALLSAHYSQPLDWNDKLLENQKTLRSKLSFFVFLDCLKPRREVYGCIFK